MDIDFEARMEEVRKLSNQPPLDPKDLFGPKYEARKEWVSMLEAVEAKRKASREDLGLAEQSIRIRLAIGQNKIETKETTEGKSDLDQALDLLMSLGDPCPCPYLLIQTHNLIGQQWSNWGEEGKAKTSLTAAQTVYDTWSKTSIVKQVEREEESSRAGSTVKEVLSEFEERSKQRQEISKSEQLAQQKDLQARLAKKRARRSGASVEEPEKAPLEEASPRSPPPAASQKGDGEEKKKPDERTISLEEVTLAKRMDRENVTTSYLLAQVLASEGESNEAAKYYLVTLNRQLELKSQDFDRVAWSARSTDLAVYYLLEGDLPAADHCLKAAELLLPTCVSGENESEERLKEVEKASKAIELTRGRYNYRVLRLCREAVEPSPDSAPKDAKVPPVRFHRLPIPAPDEKVEIFTTFPPIRNLYNTTCEIFASSKEYHDIDDHTEERIAILQEWSAAHDCMAFFEHNLQRKAELHLARLELLQEPLELLTNVIFTNILRQFKFELGSTYMQLLDLSNQQKKKNPESAPTDDQHNEWATAGRKFFTEFVDSFKEEWEWLQKQKAEEERSKVMKIDPEYCPALFMGHIYIAQTTNRFRRKEEPEKDADRKKSLEHYSEVVTKAKEWKITGDEKVNEQVRLCKELLQLLPGSEGLPGRSAKVEDAMGPKQSKGAFVKVPKGSIAPRAKPASKGYAVRAAKVTPKPASKPSTKPAAKPAAK